MKFLGKVTEIFPIETVGENQKEKMTVVLLETDEEKQYPASIAIDFWEKKIETFNEKKIKVGDIVSVPYTTTVKVQETDKGRRAFNSISGWNIRKVED